MTARVRASRALPVSLLLVAAPLLDSCGKKPAEIRIVPLKATIYGFGRTTPLKATVVDKKGEALPDVFPSWESSNPKVAEVNAAGSVKALSAGKVKITAKLEALSGSANVEVVDVASVEIAPTRATLAGAKGLRSEFKAVVKDSKGTVLDMPLRWESSDAKVVTVEKDGSVTSVGEGRANVTVNLGDMAAVAELRVTFREIAAFEATPTMLILKSGETQRLTAVVRDTAGASIEDAAVVWSSDHPATARVLNGYVTGGTPGSTTVHAMIGARRVDVSVLVN